jgi:hypothetical protein
MPAGIRQTGMVPLQLYAGMVIKLEARDPATGDPIAGVVLSNIVLYSGGPGVGNDFPDFLPQYLVSRPA